MQSLTAFLWSLGPWSWLIVAVALFFLETIVPGVHFIWFGIAATLVGIAAIATGIAWQWQVIAFALLAMMAVFWVRRFARPDQVMSDEPDLNLRGQQYLGRVVVVEDAFAGGRGRVRVGDTVWPAQGPDLPKGAKARVTGSVGTVLVVERVTA